MSQKVKYEYLENKLIAKILVEKPHPFTLGKLYPHVKSIAGNIISPDIDILQKIEPHELIIGYEVKWLHYFEKAGTSWYRFYQGIGQALCYFLHGVTHAYLVLGWDNLPEKDVSKILDYFEIFTKFAATNLSAFRMLNRSIATLLTQAPIYRCLGLIAFDEAGSKCHIKGDVIEVRREKFPIDTIQDKALQNEIETKRTKLLATKPNLKYDENFIEKWKN